MRFSFTKAAAVAAYLSRGCAAGLGTGDSLVQAVAHRLPRAPRDAEDDECDRDADDGVGPLEAEGHERRAEDDCEGDEPVDARVVPVRHEGRAVETASGAEAHLRGDLVPEEADDAGNRDQPQMREIAWVEQPVDGLVQGDAGADEDRKKATPRGTAVNASPTLCTRSASSATLPLVTRMTAWIAAVAPSTARLIATARTPARLRTIERSTRPWL
jgi:hypothetical protein